MYAAQQSLVVTVTQSWPACHEFESKSSEAPSCRGAMHVKSVEAQTSSRWCSVEVRRGCASSDVVLVL
ncbi:hypothetical protein TNCV_2194701 [Trichonephila clavipes]|uniref:Uncharacterized protein n=1 Tax=Trichonephila clavipes TaxID=2585209 RepID=A0A8X6SBX6_TRICX|nr:hypothetical protein TNCV_2194701 [Trichonephila clavipes]